MRGATPDKKALRSLVAQINSRGSGDITSAQRVVDILFSASNYADVIDFSVDDSTVMNIIFQLCFRAEAISKAKLLVDDISKKKDVKTIGVYDLFIDLTIHLLRK